jgi:hypothetical protein
MARIFGRIRMRPRKDIQLLRADLTHQSLSIAKILLIFTPVGLRIDQIQPEELAAAGFLRKCTRASGGPACARAGCSKSCSAGEPAALRRRPREPVRPP